MNLDEPENLEGWTDYPVMILKVPPKAVLTWVLGKKGKMVKILQMLLNSYQRYGISEYPPSDRSCIALGTQTTLQN